MSIELAVENESFFCVNCEGKEHKKLCISGMNWWITLKLFRALCLHYSSLHKIIQVTFLIITGIFADAMQSSRTKVVKPVNRFLNFKFPKIIDFACKQTVTSTMHYECFI